MATAITATAKTPITMMMVVMSGELPSELVGSSGIGVGLPWVCVAEVELVAVGVGGKLDTVEQNKSAAP